MAITLTCPSCERALKVKDELAGRKIKCPQCGAVITVIAKGANSEARITAKKPQPAPPARDEDDEPGEEERPKKKKRKKGKSNQGLIIGAGLGGVAIIAVVVVLLLNRGDGAPKVAQKNLNPAPPPQNQEKEEPAPQADPVPEKRAPAGAIARVREGTVDRNKLRQLGLAYMNFLDTLKRGPKDQKEFSPYYENDHEINEYLTKKWITFIWGANRQSFAEHGTSNTILAYETDPDRAGIRLVLFGDGSVDGLGEDAFQKAPKAKGK